MENNSKQPQKAKIEKEDELGKAAEELQKSQANNVDALVSGDWKPKMIHDVPLDEQMFDRMGDEQEPPTKKKDDED